MPDPDEDRFECSKCGAEGNWIVDAMTLGKTDYCLVCWETDEVRKLRVDDMFEKLTDEDTWPLLEEVKGWAPATLLTCLITYLGRKDTEEMNLLAKGEKNVQV